MLVLLIWVLLGIAFIYVAGCKIWEWYYTHIYHPGPHIDVIVSAAEKSIQSALREGLLAKDWRSYVKKMTTEHTGYCRIESITWWILGLLFGAILIISVLNNFGFSIVLITK